MAQQPSASWIRAGRGLPALLAGAAGLVLVAALVITLVVQPWAGHEGQFASPTPTPLPPPAAVLLGAADAAPAPTPAGVRDALAALVGSSELGSRVGVSVVDPLTGEEFYGSAARTPIIPASTIKLVTAATVLAARGPAYQLETRVVAGERPGEVVLIGGGDPTLAVDEHGFYPGAARLDDLAGQVLEALDGAPVQRVIVDSGLFDGPVHGPWEADIVTGGFVGPITALMTDGGRIDPDPAQEQRASLRFREPDLAAGEALAALFGLEPAAVSRGSAPRPPAETPPPDPVASAAPSRELRPGEQLGAVSSPPILRLVELMLTTSDNVLAEALARQVALARGEPASYEGAATAMAKVLVELGIPVGGEVVFADGSGLSRQNRLTAGLLTDLLSATVTGPAQPVLAGLAGGLPVAGWSGTLADRYRTAEGAGDGGAGQRPPAPGAGMVRAKTGSLNRVNALAGLVITADGRLLAFALLTDDVPVAPERARQVLDAIAGALAGCGCR